MSEIDFGGYRLTELIGSGDTGQVYEAVDTRIGNRVTVKVLRPEFAADPGYQRRFLRGVRAAQKLTEPHIIPIYNFGEIDGRLFVVMPLLRGIGLASLLERDGPLSPQRAVEVVRQLASALYDAHRYDVVHRNIKPSNAVLSQDEFLYLTDFGIVHDEKLDLLTTKGSVPSIAAYIAPERWAGTGNDVRSDIYALAALLYTSLTGEPPFPADDLEQLIRAHFNQEPPRPSARRDGIPSAMDAVVAQGMAKDREQRYQSARELAIAAEQALRVPEQTTKAADFLLVTQDSPRRRPGRWLSRLTEAARHGHRSRGAAE